MTGASLDSTVALAAVRPLLGQAARELRRDPAYVSPTPTRPDPCRRATRRSCASGPPSDRCPQVGIDAVDRPGEIPPVRRALAEGADAMARASAIVRGDPPVQPPAELTRPRPHAERRPAHAGFGGGWGGGGDFFAGNGLSAGVVVGQMLDGGFGWGSGWGHGGGSGHSGGSDGGDGGGGGGDLGGGDWGGADFSGGDVGGGRW